MSSVTLTPQNIGEIATFNICFERDVCYAGAPHTPLKQALNSIKGERSMPIKEKDLIDLMIGIAKIQAAIIETLYEKDKTILPVIQRKVGAIGEQIGQNKKPSTFQNLPARLFSSALSTHGPNAPSLERLAQREFDRLFHKS
jgi:hypothetical protein